MTAKLIIGDVRAALRSLPDASADLVMSSPPFLALRSYLPADHPDKASEIGSEATPGEFIDTMLDVVEECRRVLAPHGSLVFELGDTYAGSGGAGGDYGTADPGAKAMREGQPKYEGSALRNRRTRNANRPRDGWPLDKCAALIPQLFAIALAYGFNPLTGRETLPWLIRNVVAWCRPNPPVGADGDKFRRATSYLTVATMARDRYWDGDAVRVPASQNTNPRTAKGAGPRANDGKAGADGRGGNWSSLAISDEEADGTRPLYDYWELPTQPYKGSHYATYPEMLVQPVVLSMCPEEVCMVCGEPRRPIVETLNALGKATRKNRAMQDRVDGPVSTTDAPDAPDAAMRRVVGRTDCGHNAYRLGRVLDPFAGSGTTLQVATRLARDAIGIDLDERNALLAQERVGMFLTDVEYLSTSQAEAVS